MPVPAVPLAQVQVQAVVLEAILADSTQLNRRLLLFTHIPQRVWEKEVAPANTVKSGERGGGSATRTMWATRRTTDRKVGTTHWNACPSHSTHPSLPRVD